MQSARALNSPKIISRIVQWTGCTHLDSFATGLLQSFPARDIHAKFARAGNQELIQILLDKGVDIGHRRDGWSYNTALHVAAKEGQFKMAEFLVGKGRLSRHRMRSWKLFWCSLLVEGMREGMSSHCFSSRLWEMQGVISTFATKWGKRR